jgi:hypothetical protein
LSFTPTSLIASAPVKLDCLKNYTTVNSLPENELNRSFVKIRALPGVEPTGTLNLVNENFYGPSGISVVCLLYDIVNIIFMPDT